jgi:hypothetical protein
MITDNLIAINSDGLLDIVELNRNLEAKLQRCGAGGRMSRTSRSGEWLFYARGARVDVGPNSHRPSAAPILCSWRTPG